MPTACSTTPSPLRVLMASAALVLLTALPAEAQRVPGAVGLGGQIGSPSGLSLVLFNGEGVSYDFLAAWDLGEEFYLNGHGIFERDLGQSPNLHYFFGPGAFVGFEDQPGDGDDETTAGISATIGLSYAFERFDIYGRITPRLSVIPETDGDVGGGIGLRYYF